MAAEKPSYVESFAFSSDKAKVTFKVNGVLLKAEIASADFSQWSEALRSLGNHQPSNQWEERNLKASGKR